MRILYTNLSDIVSDEDRHLLKGIHDLWQTDLVDMQSLSNYNDGVKLLHTCIDTFSKNAWVRLLKTRLVKVSPKHSSLC